MQEKSLAYGLKVVNDCVYKKSQLVVEEQFFFFIILQSKYNSTYMAKYDQKDDS